MSFSRRRFIKSLSRSALILSLDSVLSLALPLRIRAFAQNSKNTEPSKSDNLPKSPREIDVNFINVARDSGLNIKTIFGGEHKNKYLLETTGCGVAFYDYDNDGWLDIFLVNGSRLEGFPAGQEPISHLFKNNRDGTFTDVTAKAGLRHSGWGQGVCIGDYDNDGWEDLYVTYYGKN
ncbi:MAG: RNA-binding protein, partial [Acidobacteria bacterium]